MSKDNTAPQGGDMPSWNHLTERVHRQEKEPPAWPLNLPCGHLQPHPTCPHCAEHISLTETNDGGGDAIIR